jgi:4-amino-4-deoxy-L-arabinose transferase-like glycosyltransferase
MDANKIKQLHERSGFLLMAFVLLAIFSRVFTYFPSVIDHDESTYLIIAQQWLKGFVPYVDMVEVKPIGIFILFAAVIKVFGNSILAVRILASVFIGLTGFFIYKSLFITTKNLRLSLFSGIVSIIIVSAHRWGWSANTEIFFNLFTMISLFIFLKSKQPLAGFLAGFVLGLGFMIKYMVLFDFAAFLLFVFMIEHRKAKRKAIFKSALAIIGFIIPFAVVNWAYYWIGQYELFYFASFVIPGNYSSEFYFSKALGLIGNFYLANLPFSVLWLISVVFLVSQKNESRKWLFLFIVWSFLSWIAIIITGKNSPHYLIQAIPPFSMFCLYFLQNRSKLAIKIMTIKPKFIVLTIIVLIVGVNLHQYIVLPKRDYPKELANHIKKQMDDDDSIYVSYKNVIYFLLNKKPASKYVHPSLLINLEHIKAFGVDVKKEQQIILNQRPDYIITLNKPPSFMRNYVNEFCELEFAIPEKNLLVYKKLTPN